jgi:hypothetical protein
MTRPEPKNSAPPPDLRIVPVECIFPHEEHDSQRSAPLMHILREADVLTNPPIVAPMNDSQFVVLDGANRYHCFRELGYEHLLVQVASYESIFVELGVWQHIISDWEQAAFLDELHNLPDVGVRQGWDYQAVAQILTRNGTVLSVDAPAETIADRNRTLRQIVHIYQRRATLSRTAITDPTAIWPLYPDAIALVLFPPYRPEDIIAAAEEKAFLPPGVSRHIINGRALKLNYPMQRIKDTSLPLDEKNQILQEWFREKLAKRAVRYYAESTYIFDE